MPAARNISPRQFELLVEYVETHQDVALGRLPGGPLGVQRSRLAWNEVASTLNAVGDGTTKTGDQWRRYWIELKARTKAKGVKLRQMAERTGAGGGQRQITLCQLEQRILAVIGPVTISGLPELRIPLNSAPNLIEPAPATAPESSPDPSPNSHQSSMQYLEVEFLDDTTNTLPSSSTPVPPNPPTIRAETIRERSPLRRNRNRRDQNVPPWAFSLEETRIELEREHVAVLRQIAGILDVRLGAIERAVTNLANNLNR